MSFPIEPRLQCFPNSNPPIQAHHTLGNHLAIAFTVPVRPDEPSTWALAKLKWLNKAWPTYPKLHLPCVIRGDGNSGDDSGGDGGVDDKLEKSTKSRTVPHEDGPHPIRDQQGRALCFAT